MRTVSLFSGCLGLDLGLEAVGAEPILYCENDKDCQKVIAAQRPDVPLSPDVRDLDDAVAAEIGEVDWLVGGFPCQDLSHAGQGKGLAGDRSALWFEMARAIRIIRPRCVLIENVPGIITKSGARPGESALGTVICDLAEAGYVGSQLRVRAADVGAPHGRERIFILATDALADAGGARWWEVAGGAPADEGESGGWTADENHVAGGAGARGLRAAGGAAIADPGSERFNGSGGSDPDDSSAGRQYRRASAQGYHSPPADADGSGFSEHGGSIAMRTELGSVERGGGETLPDASGEPGQSGIGRRTTGGSDSRAGTEERDGDRLDGSAERGQAIAAPADTSVGGRQRRTPDERPRDARDGKETIGVESVEATRDSAGHDVSWGTYEPAVRRWERILGVAAPRPTDDRGRLNPAFVEWMMALPIGWTDVEGVGRTARLRMLGNAVVPPVATLAYLIGVELLEPMRGGDALYGAVPT